VESQETIWLTDSEEIWPRLRETHIERGPLLGCSCRLMILVQDKKLDLDRPLGFILEDKWLPSLLASIEWKNLRWAFRWEFVFKVNTPKSVQFSFHIPKCQTNWLKWVISREKLNTCGSGTEQVLSKPSAPTVNRVIFQSRGMGFECEQ
jgi:hypothetical protein